jgi:hypothetical protein
MWTRCAGGVRVCVCVLQAQKRVLTARVQRRLSAAHARVNESSAMPPQLCRGVRPPAAAARALHDGNAQEI